MTHCLRGDAYVFLVPYSSRQNEYGTRNTYASPRRQCITEKTRYEGPTFTLGSAALPARPLAKNSSRKDYFALSKRVRKFNFLALVVSEMMGSKFTLGALRPPHAPGGNCFHT